MLREGFHAADQGFDADMLSRAGKRAGLLAEYADAARIVGQACECVYDSLTAYQSLPKGEERAAEPLVYCKRALDVAGVETDGNSHGRQPGAP